MTSSVGNILLWISLFLSLLQFLIPLTKYNNIPINRIAVTGLFLSIFLAFLALVYSFVISDFSILNVFQNSHTSKPLFYKISASWGSHEGSMLLWLFVLTLFNILLYKLYNQSNIIFISKALQTQAIIIFGFILFILITSNPFEKINYTPQDGLGFNPVLQDPALAFHPPLLYIGYVGFSAVFSLSIATLSIHDVKKFIWHTYMKSFVVLSWSFLTAGIALGSIWAYYELGWGGWWFWDPVENAALMPWILGTALLHSLISVEKNKSLESWVLLLAILVFILCLIGTFLVRSGILTSVHTFALDPARGVYILFFISLIGGYSLILFSLRVNKFFNKKFFSFFSKEGSIFVNNIFMIIVCFSIFFGTIYPLIVEIFTDNKISVGEPYFNSTVIPIITPAILIMGIVPFLSWRKIGYYQLFKETYMSLIFTIMLLIIFYIIYGSYNLFGLIGITLFSWIFCNIIIDICKKIKKEIKNNKFSIIYFNKYFNSMSVAHIGFSLIILGITASSIWQDEKILNMKIDDRTKIKNYTINFNKIKQINGPNFIGFEGNFIVSNEKNKFIANLKPQNRLYLASNNTTTEVSIHTNLLRDLYLVLGDGNPNDGWVVRIYHNPLVIWIWIGTIIVIIGGIIALKNNIIRLKNKKE